jgi:PKD repeat protein
MVISFLGTFNYLAYAFAQTQSASADDSITTTDTAIVDTATPVKVGDATVSSKFVIDNHFVDPDNNCEFCTRMVYTPGSQEEAGVAYKDDKLNLGNSQRIVFFARAEKTGEEVSFVAAGNGSSITSRIDTDIFPKIDFAVVTENVTLTNKWQRFQIGLNDTQLNDATYPFGIQLAGDSGQKQIFYVKGVTLDSKLAQDPLPTVSDSLNGTSSANTTALAVNAVAVEPLKVQIDANSTNSPAPATIEFKANSTGGLEPYSFSWNFGDGSNGTNVGKEILHTFTKPGDYNITLAAKDSGTPSQNAPAITLLTIALAANKTVVKPLTVQIDGNSTNSSAPAALAANSTIANSAVHNSEKDPTPKLELTNLDRRVTSSNISLITDANKTGEISIPKSNPPIAEDKSVTTDSNNEAYIALAGTARDNDAVTFDLVSQPSKGILVGFDKKTGTVTYIPNPSYSGSDSFTFKVIDIHNAESNVAQISVKVNPIRNTPPDVSDISTSTPSGEPLSIVLRGSGADKAEGLKFFLLSNPSHGKLSHLSNIDQMSARVTYTPNRGYSGNDVFQFNADDLSGRSSKVATVSVTVIPPSPALNSSPVSSSQSVKIEQNKRGHIALGGTDVDGYKLTYSIVTDPFHGKIIAFNSSTGKLTYKPDENFVGQDSFRFKVMDHNKLDSNIAKVSIRVTSAGVNPSSNSYVHPLTPDKALTTEDITRQLSPEPINHNPSANAGLDRAVYERTNDVTLKCTGKDPDGDALSYYWEQTAGQPVDLIGANSARPTFNAPDLDGDKVLRFEVTVTDVKGGQDTDDVKISIKDKDLVNSRLFQDQTQGHITVNQTFQQYR